MLERVGISFCAFKIVFRASAKNPNTSLIRDPLHASITACLLEKGYKELVRGEQVLTVQPKHNRPIVMATPTILSGICHSDHLSHAGPIYALQAGLFQSESRPCRRNSEDCAEPRLHASQGVGNKRRLMHVKVKINKQGS